MFDQGTESCRLLAQTYSAVLAQCGWLAVEHVAMPALGCGVHGWNLDDAAEICLRAIAKHTHSAAIHPRYIDLCFKEDEAWDAFRQAAASLLGCPHSDEMDDEMGAKHDMEVWRVGPSPGAKTVGRL